MGVAICARMRAREFRATLTTTRATLTEIRKALIPTRVALVKISTFAEHVTFMSVRLVQNSDHQPTQSLPLQSRHSYKLS